MIGRALIERLVSGGWGVIALVHPGSSRLRGLVESDDLRLISCDAADYDSLRLEDVGHCDVFFHLAWVGAMGERRFDPGIQERNIAISLGAARLAQRLTCSCFVGVGSQAEYGRVDGTISPDTPCRPENPYGAAKLCAGEMTRYLCEKQAIRHVWARVFSVYGPFDTPGTLVSSTIRSLLSGQVPELTACEQEWDYLYCSDAADALVAMAESGVDGSTYCIGSGHALPLRDYVEQIRNAIDPSLKVGYGVRPYGERQVMHLCADISSLTRDTGFVPSVSFPDGMARTIEWQRREMK